MTKQIASISISGRMTLNMHSLNNEGGEGNQIITRQLTIIGGDGEEHTVNGISGDMFKHIHVGHLINQAKEKGLPLCSNCKIGNPNRLSSGEDLGTYFAENENYTDKDIADAIIKKCIIDDTHGVLITKIGSKNKNHARKSIVEFAWAVGIPEINNTETYIHTKVVSDAGSQEKGAASNEGQNIFHRPANHGIYAFVCSIDVYRLSYNDVTRTYPEISDRNERYKALLSSLLNTFLNPKGAMTSTQKPHITDFEGVLSISSNSTPAPTVSPINEDFKTEIETIKNNLNKIEGKEVIEVKEFNGFGKLSEIFEELIKAEPYKIN